MLFFISCASGLSQILKKELQMLGYKPTILKPTLLSFSGEIDAIAKVNLRARTANKLYLQIASQNVSTFDQLFDFIYTQDWAKYISRGNKISVQGISSDSKLHSTPSIQSISAKAIYKKLGIENTKTNDQGLMTNNHIEIQVSIENNECVIMLNTTGESLHKRGYKTQTGEAPINEALAAGLVLLSGWKFSQPLYDIFCGSGTIIIEAALIAKNIAPGLHRKFAFQSRARFNQSILTKEIENAKSKIMTDKAHTIIGSDIDPKIISIAKQNAHNAGVSNYIHFKTQSIKDYLKSSPKYQVASSKIQEAENNDNKILNTGYSLLGTMISNPPYGQRMNPKDLEKIYKDIATLFADNPKLNGGIITSYDKFSQFINSKDWKKIQLFNGGEPCNFYKRTIF